jgi:transposase InsO family protein
VIAWKLCTGMAASDITETLEMALTASGCTQARVRHQPRLQSDEPCYIASELAQWLDKRAMDHIRGAPCHPQTQDKIERWQKNPSTRRSTGSRR